MSHLTDAFQSTDKSDLLTLLDADVVLNSPVRESGFSGRDTVAHILSQARDFITGFECVQEIRQNDVAVIRIAGTVDGKVVDASYQLQLTPTGTVREMSVYIRPMSGLQAFANEMGKRLGMIPR